ncbi:MAG: DNRLRE domain-containing protein [Gemmatimonas sp.]
MRAFRATAIVVVTAISGALLATCSDVNTLTRVDGTQTMRPRADVTTAADPMVVAAGDAVCGTGTPAGTPCKHAAVASLITSLNPTAVLLLGDNQYENGTLSDYNTYYNASWGAFKSITKPSAGNHEYNTANASGYYDYFNGVGVQAGPAGDRAKGYYSFNLGAWHLIALNSNCSAIGGCGAGSAQEQWLRADLAANTNACTLAYWHHPRFSSGSHGNNTSVQPLWQALYDLGADLVLGGHDHIYERFAPQTPTGVLDNVRGIREFVVGTGGKEQSGFSTIKANSQLRSNTSYGALQLTLRPTSYDWAFAPIPGNTLSDAGSAACYAGVTPPPPPPPTQTTLTISASADAYTLQGSSNSNFGTRTTLLVDGSPAARTYFKFAVTGIGTKSVVSAKLRLYAVDPSDTGGRLHRVSSTSWGETTIKWSNAPAYTAAVIGTIGAVVSGSWYEVDVTGQVTADGTVSFALESTSTNGADYRSREGGSSTAPRLIVVVN